MAKNKPNPKTSQVETNELIDNEEIKEFAKKLLAVPKKEIDEIEKMDKALQKLKRKSKP